MTITKKDNFTFNSFVNYLRDYRDSVVENPIVNEEKPDTEQEMIIQIKSIVYLLLTIIWLVKIKRCWLPLKKSMALLMMKWLISNLL